MPSKRTHSECTLGTNPASAMRTEVSDMSTEAIVGAVATALEPAAAQLLEQLHADVSKEAERLEAEMPDRMDAAEQAVKYWAGDAMTVIHRLIAKIDVARGGASAVPPTQSAESSPADSAPSPSASTVPPASSTSPAITPTAAASLANSASSSTPTAPNASPTSSPAGTAAPSDGKPGA